MKLIAAEVRESFRFPVPELCIVAVSLVVIPWTAYTAGRAAALPCTQSLTIIEEYARSITLRSYGQVAPIVALLTTILSSLSLARDYERGKMHLIFTLIRSRGIYVLSKALANSVLPILSAVYSLGLAIALSTPRFPWLAYSATIVVLSLESIFFALLSTLIATLAKRLVPSLVLSTLTTLLLSTLAGTLELTGRVSVAEMLPPLSFRKLLAAFMQGKEVHIPASYNIVYMLITAIMLYYYSENKLEVSK